MLSHRHSTSLRRSGKLEMISDVQRMLKPGAICEGMNMKITSIYDDTGAKKKKVRSFNN